MTADDRILAAIRRDPTTAELLSRVCEFELERADHGEPVRLSSGQPVEGIAGDSSGGTFFLCGQPGPHRPVLYASSEGQAGLIGRSLAEALEHLVGLPSWHDCLKFSSGGDLSVMRTTLEHLQRDEVTEQPELAAQRTRVAEALSLDLATPSALLSRLHDVVVSGAADFVLVTEDGDEYESLFGDWSPERVWG